jgi:tRNA(Leu) C34 or U34 (ribose-2'-O)-methylase TrmL
MDLIVAIETSRKRNIGTILRTAVAFGCKLIAIVGSPKVSTHGAQGAQKYIKVIHFYTWSDCLAFAQSSQCTSIAVSPHPIADRSIGATQLCQQLSSRAIMFIVGGADGLSDDVLSFCDHTVHINFPFPAHGSLVSYDNKIGMCLQEFVSRASASAEVNMTGQKFVIDCTAVYGGYKSDLRQSRAAPNEFDVQLEGDLDGVSQLFA